MLFLVISDMAGPEEEKVDFLESDAPIPGQRYCLVSFVLPESMVQKRELYYMTEFFKKMCETLEIDKSKVDKMSDDFESFKELNGQELDRTFAAANKQRTSVFGVKVRGSYDTEEECKFRGKKLQRIDPNSNIFLGEVGKWLPVGTNIEYHIENQEYLEEGLQTLMKNYRENQKDKDELYAQQKRERMDNAVRHNVKIADVESVKESLEGFDHQKMKEAFDRDHSHPTTSAADEGTSSGSGS